MKKQTQLMAMTNIHTCVINCLQLKIKRTTKAKVKTKANNNNSNINNNNNNHKANSNINHNSNINSNINNSAQRTQKFTVKVKENMDRVRVDGRILSKNKLITQMN